MLAGIDVSKWQRTTPDLKGLSFAFARATYATYPDPRYVMHAKNFKAHGLVVGAYCFGTGFKSGAEQAKAFLKIAGGADLLVLDFERDTFKTMSADQAKEFIRFVHLAGRKVGLYHSRSGFPSFGQDYNWVAQWGKKAPSGIKWAFWQWQGTPLDKDYFNGTKDDLLVLAGRKVAAPVPREEPVSPLKIAALKHYIANLSAVKRPTTAISKRLAEYRARLAEYLKRGKA